MEEQMPLLLVVLIYGLAIILSLTIQYHLIKYAVYVALKRNREESNEGLKTELLKIIAKNSGGKEDYKKLLLNDLIKNHEKEIEKIKRNFVDNPREDKIKELEAKHEKEINKINNI